ncbi:MAG: hypothetical protein AABZ55_02470 [Bdellovibrionota bacterium]
MDRERKIELLQRSLGLRHKIKVHESMKAPDNHEELALFTLSKWDLEDELKAIEEILNQWRLENIKSKKQVITKGGPHNKARSQKKK